MRKQIAFAFLFAVAGCGGGNSSPDGKLADMSTSDLTMAPDMSRPTTTLHYVTSMITLPKSSKDFAADLNGDGKVENGLGAISATLLAAENIDLPMQEAMSVAAGNGLVLFSFSTGDPQLETDPMAQTVVYEALPQAAPDFSGSGVFQVDKTVMKGTVTGPLASGAFASADPLTLTAPPTVNLKIPLYTDTFVTLPVVGARLAFTPSKTGLAAGQLNGALRATDIQTILIPALAMTFTSIAMANPCDANCMTTRNTFDKGNCMNPDGSAAVAGDNKIDICEVANNGLVTALLAPDVQLFDDMGNWKPNPSTKGNLDSLSIGVAFTGVIAKFTE